MTKTSTTVDTAIPAFLKREINAKGVTLSAGPAQPAVTVKSGKGGKRAAKAAKAAKAALVETAPLATVTPEPVIDAATGEPLVKVRRSIVPMRFKERYAKHGGTCGDDMALELKAAKTMLNADKRETLDLAALKAIAAENGIDTAKYEGMNNGQWRMNIGNKLRGALKGGKDVTIGKRTFKAEDMAVN